MTSCPTRPVRLWCGTDYCETHANGNSDRDKDGADLRACPTNKHGAEYIHEKFQKYPQSWPAADVYRRVCVKKTVQPSNWKTVCALGRQDTKYCPDGWCGPDSANAQKHMKTLCSTTDNIFNNPDCKEWFKKYPAKKEHAYTEKCNLLTNIGKPECRTYCRNNPGKCDQIQTWCDLHPSDKMCSCYTSALATLGSAGPPVSCFDNNCIQHGYMSKAMSDISKACPNYIDCKQIIDITDTAVLDNVSIQQKCSITESTGDTASQNSEQNTDETQDPSEAHFLKQKYDDLTADGPLKDIADKVDEIIPDMNLEIGTLKLDEIKLFVVIFLIIVIVAIQQNQSRNNYPGPYGPGPYGPVYSPAPYGNTYY